MAKYTFHVVVTGFDPDRAKELREALALAMPGSGREQRGAVLRQVADGQRVPVYHSNSRQDAEDIARGLGRAGGTAEVER